MRRQKLTASSQKGTFLVSIGADLSHKRDSSSNTSSNDESDSKTKQHPLVISEVLDKVVQDVTGEEGTGIWSNTEAIELHVPAFTLNIAHAFRLASAFRGDREKANKVLNGGFPPSELNIEDKGAFIEDLRQATYAACLASFIQGFNIIARADQEHKWDINYSQVWQIWRAGCIIQADYISDEILAPILKSKPSSDDLNLNFSSRVAEDVRKRIKSYRRSALRSSTSRSHRGLICQRRFMRQSWTISEVICLTSEAIRMTMSRSRWRGSTTLSGNRRRARRRSMGRRIRSEHCYAPQRCSW
jgi:6-phosphogluconate dehydrogenase